MKGNRVFQAVLCIAAAAMMLTVGCGGGGSKKPINLPAPDAVTASDGTSSSDVAVSWTAVSGAVSYKIYRSDSISGTYASIATSTSVSKADSTAVYQTTYFYKVAAVASDGTVGALSQPDSGYSDANTSDLILTAANGDSLTQVAVSWTTAATGIQDYELWRCDSAAGTYTQIATPTAKNYDDTNVQPGKNYYYKVRAVTAKSNTGQFSGYDNGFAKLATPAGFTVSQGTSTSKVTLQWTAVSYAATYVIYQSTTSTGTFTKLAEVTGTTGTNSYDDSSAGSNAGADYYYKVTAVSSTADGALEGDATSVSSGYASLLVPSAVAASDGIYYTSVKLTWQAVANASSYIVYRDGTNVGTSSALSYTDTLTAAASPASHSYTVSAVRNGHEGAQSSADSGIQKATAVNQSYTISWTANKEKAVNSAGGGYKIEACKDSSFPSGVKTVVALYDSGSASPTTGTVSFSSSETGTWYIRVTAFSSIGGGSYSIPSAQTTVTVE